MICRVPELDFARFDALTFDCYGTLIDWESRSARSAPRRAARDIGASDDELLEEYARHEAAAERGPYRPYREVLAAGLRGVAADRGRRRSEDDVVARFSESVARLAGVPGLGRGAARPRRSGSARRDHELRRRPLRRVGREARGRLRLGRHGRAGRARTSRAMRPFELAFETIDVPAERILHVAQSLYHDHVPGEASSA